MGRPAQSISQEELADISRQCEALHQDWQRFYQLAASPPGAGDGEQQLAFIQLQSRLSCDYPILSQWRKGDLGLASHIGKLVAQAGTLQAFAVEARAGDGPLVREWQTVNEAIARVRALLESARQKAKEGKPVTLPKEIAPPKQREPFPFRAVGRKVGIACAVLACCVLVFFIARPFVLQTGFFKWVDSAYTAWQLRNGIEGLTLAPEE